MKKILLISLLLFIGILIFIIFSFGGSEKIQEPNVNFPTPTIFLISPQKTPGQEASSDDYSLTPKEQAEEVKKFATIELVNIVPYTGNFFTLDYDYDNAKFVLKLDKNNTRDANKELSTFLNAHKIKDLSWFENISISYY